MDTGAWATVHGVYNVAGKRHKQGENYKSRWKRMGRMGSQSFMGTKYQFGKMKSSRG